MMDQRNDRVGMPSSICADQRWMIEFVLNQDVEWLVMRRLLRTSRARNDTGPWEPKPNIIHEMCAVISPGQGNDFHAVPLCTKIFDQLAIVQISTTYSVQGTIDDQADFHRN